MTKYSNQMWGFASTKEKAEEKLREIEENTDYHYEIRSYDKHSWYIWRLDKKNDE